MDSISFIEVLEETISEIEKQISNKECLFVKRLRQLRELAQRKFLNNDNFDKDTKQKPDSMVEKKNQLEGKLKALREHARKELSFKAEIIERNKSLITERIEQHQRILAAERAMYEQQMALANSAFQMREEQEFKSKIVKMMKQLGESRITNVAIERSRRREWTQRKDVLQGILNDYNTRMKEQEDKLEYLAKLHEHEKSELQRYQVLCQEQDEPFDDLMREKEEYLDSVRQQKLYEIRVKIAERTIVRFVERYYPIWKKKKLKAAKKKSKYKSRYAR